MPNVIRKTEMMLDKFEKSAGLTCDGRRWLIAAIDPYHDTIVKPEGYPDNYVGGSIVQVVKQQMTVTAPAIIGTGTWDCHIFNLPWLTSNSSTQMTISNVGNDLLSVSASPLATIGGITAVSGPPGSDLSLLTNPQAFSGSTNSITLPASYFAGPFRVIAQGFEVTNTTSLLNVQGAVTVYRQPQPQPGARHCMRLNSGTAQSPINLATFSTEFWLAPPSSVANAQLLAGSKVWDAKEGAYVVLTQRTTELSDPVVQPVVPLTVAPGFTALAPPSFCYYPFVSSTSIPAYIPTHDHNLGGAYFTGLSSQTSLTVTWNVYIERFPTPGELDLVVLATPSPVYDPVAFELYSRCLSDMPVGVPVSENNLGDWFAEAVAGIAPYLGGALSALPHPLAQAGAFAVKAAGKVARGYLQPPGGNNPEVTKAASAKRKKKRKAAKAAAKRALAKT
jgi:hypothetical protein